MAGLVGELVRSGPEDLRFIQQQLLALERLHLQKLLQAEGPQFATNTRLFVAAKGRNWVEIRTVDRDLPSPEPTRYLFGVRFVAGPHATR